MLKNMVWQNNHSSSKLLSFTLLLRHAVGNQHTEEGMAGTFSKAVMYYKLCKGRDCILGLSCITIAAAIGKESCFGKKGDWLSY